MSAEETTPFSGGPTVRFDGQVAIVTGAGGGLGRAYALALAARGAKVVVNDVSVNRDGSSEGGVSRADAVVEEICAAGGEAVANYDSIATQKGGESLLHTAMSRYERVDILINNAGILRDKSFSKMEADDWEAVRAVHLDGAFYSTHPVFKVMREQGYGRIMMTSSAAGLFGNFGQANYSAAKLGLVGLMLTLAQEGKKYNIHVNTVAPVAASRMTETILPPDMLKQLAPEFVVPLVLWLCSSQCPTTGGIFNAAMGTFSQAQMVSGAPVALAQNGKPPSPEEVAQQWSAVASVNNATSYPNAMAFLSDFLNMS